MPNYPHCTKPHLKLLRNTESNEIERSLLNLPKTDLKTDKDIDKYINDLTKILTTHAEISIPHSSYNPHIAPYQSNTYILLSKPNVGYGCPRADPRGWSSNLTAITNEPNDNSEMSLTKNTNCTCAKCTTILTERRKSMCVCFGSKPRSSRIYLEIRNEEGVIHTDPRGIAETFAQFYKKSINTSRRSHF